MKRYLEPYISEDLAEKMVFVGGPRQVGKTTLALNLLKTNNVKHPAYLNWDNTEDKSRLAKGQIPSEEPLVILGEIHKFKNWRNLVKGFYDKNKGYVKILVTGSSQMDYYRRGGDSLQGRYHYYRLHPFTLAEVGFSRDSLDVLLRFGGFPEPFFKASSRDYKRWQKERLSRIIRDDLVSLENVREVSRVELLQALLPERVGSLLSVNNLSQDLSVAFETADHWIQILERLYYCYRIKPYGLPKLKASKKEKKLYLWDWSQCPTEPSAFENCVASHLLKFCHFQEDLKGDEMELNFIRDAYHREIDFVVTCDKKPLFAVECKSGDGDLSKNINYFSERTTIPMFYQVHLGKRDYEIKDKRARVLPFIKLAKILGL